MRILLLVPLLAILAPVAASAEIRPTEGPIGPAIAGSVNLSINFENHSAVLQSDAHFALDNLGAALSSPGLAGKKFRICGHTDARGSASGNLALSRRRAEAVRDYLIANFNIPPENLIALGCGSTRPLLPDDPENAANRRIEIINLTPTPE
jgi:OmpA-OmpF porin, OOP family